MDSRDFGSRQGFGSRKPIPIKEGETIDVEIEGIGAKGDGIAKVQGYVIIVPNVKKGDKVKVKINAVRGKVSFAEVVGEGSSGGGNEEESGEDEGSEEKSSEEGEESEEDEEEDMGEDAGDLEEEEQ